MMMWATWLAGSTVLFLIGAYLFRSGSRWIVKTYIAVCAILFVLHFMNMALVFGPEYISWPKYALLAFLPGTLILMIWAIKRDREEVMGLPTEREAAMTAAIVYGAGSYAEMSDVGGGMDSQ